MGGGARCILANVISCIFLTLPPSAKHRCPKKLLCFFALDIWAKEYQHTFNGKKIELLSWPIHISQVSVSFGSPRISQCVHISPAPTLYCIAQPVSYYIVLCCPTCIMFYCIVFAAEGFGLIGSGLSPFVRVVYVLEASFMIKRQLSKNTKKIKHLQKYK